MGKASLQPTCPLRVLVVDDFDDARDSLCMLLRIWGCQAEPAADGPQALAAAPAFRPHVVLIELALPGMDGYETARRLGELPQLARLVAVTTCGGTKTAGERAARGSSRMWSSPRSRRNCGHCSGGWRDCFAWRGRPRRRRQRPLPVIAEPGRRGPSE